MSSEFHDDLTPLMTPESKKSKKIFDLVVDLFGEKKMTIPCATDVQNGLREMGEGSVDISKHYKKWINIGLILPVKARSGRKVFLIHEKDHTDKPFSGKGEIEEGWNEF